MATTLGKRILIAEDNPALLSVVRFNLERAGFQVTAARNGREAWEQLEKGQCFDLVVTDHQMPLMTGCELCERIRGSAEHRDVPVFMLTAKGLELDRVRLQQELGVQAVFAKPFSPVALVQAIEKQLATPVGRA